MCVSVYYTCVNTGDTALYCTNRTAHYGADTTKFSRVALL